MISVAFTCTCKEIDCLPHIFWNSQFLTVINHVLTKSAVDCIHVHVPAKKYRIRGIFVTAFDLTMHKNCKVKNLLRLPNTWKIANTITYVSDLTTPSPLATTVTCTVHMTIHIISIFLFFCDSWVSLHHLLSTAFCLHETSTSSIISGFEKQCIHQRYFRQKTQWKNFCANYLGLKLTQWKYSKLRNFFLSIVGGHLVRVSIRTLFKGGEQIMVCRFQGQRMAWREGQQVWSEREQTASIHLYKAILSSWYRHL